MDGGHHCIISTDRLLIPSITFYLETRRLITKPGTRVSVIGIGGLGHLALQFAAALGAEVGAHQLWISATSFVNLSNSSRKWTYWLNVAHKQQLLTPLTRLLRSCCWHYTGLLRSCCWHYTGLLRSCCWHYTGLLRSCCWHYTRLLRSCCWHYTRLSSLTATLYLSSHHSSNSLRTLHCFYSQVSHCTAFTLRWHTVLFSFSGGAMYCFQSQVTHCTAFTLSWHTVLLSLSGDRHLYLTWQRGRGSQVWSHQLRGGGGWLQGYCWHARCECSRILGFQGL
jgi:hypothetical protein